jgi:hypothetical protein
MQGLDQKFTLSGGAAMGQGSHPQCRRFSALPMSSATTGVVTNTHANTRTYSDTNAEYKSVGHANRDPHSGTDGDTFPGAPHPNPHTRPF